jgi:hypothetical protein
VELARIGEAKPFVLDLSARRIGVPVLVLREQMRLGIRALRSRCPRSLSHFELPRASACAERSIPTLQPSPISQM